MTSKINWRFPLPRTHTGILQGNAILGVMIWGEENILRITVGRSDLWDHRGGMPWTEKQRYTDIRRLLEANDKEGIRKTFETTTQDTPGQPRRPSLIPIGRIEIDFGSGARIESGTLRMRDGSVAIAVRKAQKKQTVKCHLDMASPLLCIELPKLLAQANIRRVPSFETIPEDLKKISFEPPEALDELSCTGWIQKLPADPPVCVGYRREERTIWLAVERGSDSETARAEATADLDRATAEGTKNLAARNKKWWSDYWGDVPTLKVPNETIQYLHDYGMYKFAGLCQPDGVAAGLQGPWIEEYQMPPWSGDYHFNINVQMCYWPAYRGNRLSHLRPLFEQIWSWLPKLKHNARVFLGIDDGIMLPHAVDDQCMCMGGFWTGTIDHGCTAWVADMMWNYYRYSMDASFLRERAYPFMVGAMRVYEEMLERDGEAIVLPVSVSPEYRGASMNAWGRNASFQLACIHRLCEDLVAAAEVLGQEPKPIWQEILEKLPKVTLIGEDKGTRIALWEGTPLEESHRHHSHLAAIAPFDVIDVDSSDWRPIVQSSHNEWVRRGMGMWSGWCVPWASMLHTRLGNPEMSELLLEIWERIYTNEGKGTLHDVNFPGFSLIGAGVMGSFGRDNEKMQMDAGMGAVAAIHEMLLHSRRGVHYLFAGCPRRWRKVSFNGLRTEGAFLVGAARQNGVVKSISIRAEHDGVFRLANPWDTAVVISRKAGSETTEGKVLYIQCAAGERVKLLPE